MLVHASLLLPLPLLPLPRPVTALHRVGALVRGGMVEAFGTDADAKATTRTVSIAMVVGRESSICSRRPWVEHRVGKVQVAADTPDRRPYRELHSVLHLHLHPWRHG